MSPTAASRPGWKPALLEDLVFFQRGFDITKADQEPGDIPVVSSAGVSSFHSVAKVEGPGIVIGRKGTLGTVHFVDEPYWPHDTTLWSRDLKGNHPRFVYYFMHTLGLERYDVGSSNPTLNRNHIHGLNILLPDFPIQESIAGILGAFDDLIENNTRRIKLLGVATRLLYEEWFVRLRFPGHEHTRINCGVPTGWRTVPLGDITTKIGSGFTPRGGEASYLSEGTPLIRSQNVYDDAFHEEGLAFVSEQHAADLAGASVQSKDILLNITGASVGRCCMAPERWLPARVNQHVMIIRVDLHSANPFHVHQAINSDERKRQLLSYAQKGSTREALTKEMIANFEITLPSEPLAREFGGIAEKCFRQREVLAHQNQKLRAVRDLLLPRLMSGEVAV